MKCATMELCKRKKGTCHIITYSERHCYVPEIESRKLMYLSNTIAVNVLRHIHRKTEQSHGVGRVVFMQITSIIHS